MPHCSRAGRQSFLGRKVDESRRHQLALLTFQSVPCIAPRLLASVSRIIQITRARQTGAARSPAGSAHNGRKPSDTICLTSQSRGTIIVPIMVPLSPALGAKIHSKDISVFCAHRVSCQHQTFRRNFA